MVRAGAAGAALVVAVALAGCGSSSSGRSSPPPASSSSGASTAKDGQAVNPNAPETNPAGDIPDDQVYVLYRPPGGGYAVKVPEGWARAESGGAVTFTDKLNSVRMESRSASSAPTVASVKRGDVLKLSQAVRGFKLQSVGTVQRKAGTAVRATYLADSRPDDVTGKVVRDAVERYVFFHRGKEVVLTLSGPRGADNVDPWRIVSDSLRWTS